MKAARYILLTALAATAAAGDLAAQPPAGSQLPPEENKCAACHGEEAIWEAETLRLYVPPESLANDVHLQHGVNCHDCHGGDPGSFDPGEAHTTELPEDKAGLTAFRVDLAEVNRACGHCHQEHLATYQQSVHGRALAESGLLVTASCTDCHGAHGMYPTSDQKNPLHPSRVAATCGKCHRLIGDRIQRSVHGPGHGPKEKPGRPATGDKRRPRPTCTSCHSGHDLADPQSTVFRVGLATRCGRCHTEMSEHYAMSIHGELTALGYGPGAKCSDCHGAHDVLAASDPASRLFYDPSLPAAENNRWKTCQVCHPRATANFLQFDPHADHTDPQRDPLLYWVRVGLLILLFCVFGFFGVHSALWSVRSLVHVLRHGRPRALVPGTTAYLRFGRFHRVAHACLLISFLGLALSGLPLKYSQHQWAVFLASLLGGFESTRVWHRLFGAVSICCLVVYLLRMAGRLFAGRSSGVPWQNTVFGPDSPLPNRRDLSDFLKMVRWFLGLGPKPTFERWTYWEKFDFWGACADVVIIGSTGLILWFPNLFCIVLPGKALNIAKVIHSTQALLATGFVFAIHFFNTHFRPEKFPMDLSILTGLVSEEELREERPEYLERLRQKRTQQVKAAGLEEASLEQIERTRREGRLDEIRATVPSRKSLWLIILGGWLALLVGLGLLAGMILAGLGR